MKKLVIIGLVIAGLFSPMLLVKADVNPKLNGIHPLKTEEVNSVQVKRLSGRSRIFQINDGYEEVIIRKVINWINTSRPANGVTEFESYKSPVKLKVTMSNGDVASLEPVFNCITENDGKTCTLVDSEVLYTQNKVKVRLKSQELYDWLLVGWKYESYGASKEELLDETLYFRYFTQLDEKNSDFIMCPKIDSIERIAGADRRHIVQASALNYGAHHGDVPYDRINITLSDTPENGVKITNVSIEKGISGKESRIQCRRES
ncbi:hypothetical protein [Neobacillus sp.]|uniref:hypothetical protein n=1 Tax=Neobacillus sp. TaxID=2675273 RepID=UPI00289D3355|nr:hypothetical protein [Neobacillus sp.]